MRIGIIGGGAAGMMVAATLLENESFGGEVVLFERNMKLGQKVMISGGGRCNVTTGISGVKDILKNYPRGASFLRTAMYDFQPDDLREWIEQRGVPLKCESDLRVFPKSDNGADFVGMFEKLLDDKRCEVRYRSIVEKVERDSSCEGFLVAVRGGEFEKFDKLVVACGGRAYRHTGSVGDGYEFAEKLGHTVTPVAESLNSYMVSEEWIAELAGLSFEKVGLKFVGKSSVYEFAGPIVFTHKGISGPTVFALSSLAAFEEFSPEDPSQMEIDFLPELNQEILRSEFARYRKTFGSRNLGTWMKGYVPRRLVDRFEAGVLEKNMADVSKKELALVVEFLKRFKLNLVKKTPGDEFVTAGGVSLNEVDRNTLESKICPGLYFAGEVLDVDGFTGGFNLQAAWCTGRKVGESLLDF